MTGHGIGWFMFVRKSERDGRVIVELRFRQIVEQRLRRTGIRQDSDDYEIVFG